MFENQIQSDSTRKEIFAVCQKLFTLRKAFFTTGEIAKMLKTNRQTIHNFETGKYFNFNLLDQYCGLFGFEINIVEK